MYDLIGRMKAAPGERDALPETQLTDLRNMPGYMSHILAQHPTDADARSITGAWDREASHRASLSLPSVQ